MTGGVNFHESEIKMENCNFWGSRSEDILNIIRTKFNLVEVNFSNAFSDALDVDFSHGTIIGGQFTNIGEEGGGDAIDISGSDVRVSGTRILNVEDTQSPIAGLIVHRGTVAQGDLSLGDPVTAQVDPNRRIDAARNHSGTHLLHASLRSVLGPHVRQAGSLVAPDRLRFDYSHVSPLAREELLEIQSLANQKVREDLNVSTHETILART